MDFCHNCKNYLYLKEKIENGERKLFRICKKCDFKKECCNNRIAFKIYRQTTDTNNNNYLNKYKAFDCTLPTKLSKCPKCKKNQINPYERKYINNQYQMNIICKDCHHNWFY